MLVAESWLETGTQWPFTSIHAALRFIWGIQGESSSQNDFELLWEESKPDKVIPLCVKVDVWVYSVVLLPTHLPGVRLDTRAVQWKCWPVSEGAKCSSPVQIWPGWDLTLGPSQNRMPASDFCAALALLDACPTQKRKGELSILPMLSRTACLYTSYLGSQECSVSPDREEGQNKDISNQLKQGDFVIKQHLESKRKMTPGGSVAIKEELESNGKGKTK